ncbi:MULTISPECIES: hypothetical protein [unclassified Lacinutrix]
MANDDSFQKLKTDIHIVSEKEKNLPHEAWQVILQKQGRVPANLETKDKSKTKNQK